MNVRVTWALAALILIPAVSAAADEPQKKDCISNFVFSQDFLSRHPNAGAICREVVMKNGQKWARFDGTVAELKGKQVTVNFVGSANQVLDTLTFTASPDARVTVNGQQMTYGALGKGDRLTFWVPESRAGLYAAPGATQLSEIKVARAESH
jgi:hypothetical protein